MLKLLLIASVAFVAAASDVNTTDGSHIPIPSYNTTVAPSTTQAPTTSKPTTKPTSTTPAPTTPPTTTSSTSTKSTSTTPSPSTPNTTTTEKPTSTTSGPTTTEKPTPLPPKPVEPIPGTWFVNYTNTNRTCLVVTLAAQFEIPYYYTNGTNKENYTGYVNVPWNATAVGSCGQLLQSINLQWNNSANATNNLTLTFQKHENGTKFDLHAIDVSLVPDNATLPGYNGITVISSSVINLYERKALFNTSLGHSYKCFKRQVFNLTEINSNVTKGYIQLQHLQLQAFRNSTNVIFAEAEDCAPHETPDVVPIAVGCALVVLIIIVLVAYLIGRRRNQARGYLSMFSAEKKEADYIPMKNLNCFK